MSPTVFKANGFRFFFFSKEESRMHVHVSSSKGEAKFWLEPIVALAQYFNLSQKDLREAQIIVEARSNEIKQAWKKHFRS